MHGNPQARSLRLQLRRHATLPEKLLWHALRNRQLYGFKFRRQHDIGKYIVDFYCAEQWLVVEVDGETHGNFLQRIADGERTEFFASIGVRVVRYCNAEIMQNLNDVLVDLYRRLTGKPSPTPPYKGGE